MLKSSLVVLECLRNAEVILCQHHCHVVVWEERVGFDADSHLVLLLGRSSVTFALLDDAQVVVDPHLIAEVIANVLQCLDRFIASTQLLERHRVVGRSFLVSVRLQ